ncbi:MAG: DUF2993 domain-containing protein [Oculatellaceae cyanobacterium Prado106]|jgi:hypothetical protein|nr:DUF2993 domain-containing protein [Oculatellaceae cyanobacterium Prado106]
MSFFTILLTALLSVLAPIGLISETVAERAIRQRLAVAETLAIRIDNAPNYQLVRGRLQRVRLAGRGVEPRPGLRIAVLELETDAIALQPGSLQQGQPRLAEPLQAGVRLELTEEDVNRFLQSPLVSDRLKTLSFNLPGSGDRVPEAYGITQVEADFLENNRLQLRATLKGQQSGTETRIVAESGLAIAQGRQLQLVAPQLTLGGTLVPPEITLFLTAGFQQRLDLKTLDTSGLTARVLNLEIQADRLDLAAFVQVEPRFLQPQPSQNPPSQNPPSQNQPSQNLPPQN